MAKKKTEIERAIDDLYAAVRNLEAEKFTAMKEFDGRIAGVRQSINQLEVKSRAKAARRKPVAAGQ